MKLIMENWRKLLQETQGIGLPYEAYSPEALKRAVLHLLKTFDEDQYPDEDDYEEGGDSEIQQEQLRDLVFDFEGSGPKRAAKSLFEALWGYGGDDLAFIVRFLRSNGLQGTIQALGPRGLQGN